MSALELSVMHARRQAMREDAGATSATRDALARSFHLKTVHAVGHVHDVLGHDDELSVLLAVGGEVLTCPLLRVHGRSMEETALEVLKWRKGDQVEVTGKLNWPSFSAEVRIEVLTASQVGTEGRPGSHPNSDRKP